MQFSVFLLILINTVLLGENVSGVSLPSCATMGSCIQIQVSECGSCVETAPPNSRVSGGDLQFDQCQAGGGDGTIPSNMRQICHRWSSSSPGCIKDSGSISHVCNNVAGHSRQDAIGYFANQVEEEPTCIVVDTSSDTFVFLGTKDSIGCQPGESQVFSLGVGQGYNFLTTADVTNADVECGNTEQVFGGNICSGQPTECVFKVTVPQCSGSLSGPDANGDNSQAVPSLDDSSAPTPVDDPSSPVAPSLNCDPGVDILRDNVNVTDVAFEALYVNHTSESFQSEIRYYPEQVIPYRFRSSVYFYLIGNNGEVWPTLSTEEKRNCAFEFNFLSGNNIHSSEFDFSKSCFSTTTVGAANVYVTDVEYFYCIGTPDTCDRVDAQTLGFSKTDRESLRDDAYCTKLVYKLTITYTPGAPLDETVKFVLEYVRDPVEPIEQFFDFQGVPAILQDDVWWAICDRDDTETFDYTECTNRIAINPEPRVLSLSTNTISNEFALMFALGPSDRRYVDDEHPLTIVVENSEMWLFHARYSQSHYSSCDGLLCTKVTAEASLDVGTFGLDPQVTENYIVRLSGNMPLFVDGDLPTDMQCDVSFCTMVWVLNFRSVQTGRRLSWSKLIDIGELWNSHLEHRKLQSGTASQKSAIQGRAAKVTIGSNELDFKNGPRVSGKDSIPLLVPIAVAICLVVVVVFAVCYRRQKRKLVQEEEEDRSVKKSSSLNYCC